MSGLTLIKRSPWIFYILILEGYVVLASEILAIRQLVPFVGSNIETVAIVIAAVLIPLAAGYYYGALHQPIKMVRLKLSKNFLVAICLLSLGLSYIIIDLFFYVLELFNIHQYLLQTVLYVSTFLIYPVFLLAQTLPLLSHYLRKHNPALVSGSTLFFSTLGSFLGSIVTTLVLMNYFGVNAAVIVVIAMLCIMMFLLRRPGRLYTSAIGLFFVLCLLLNSPLMMEQLNVVATTPYSQIQIRSEDAGQTKRMLINHSNSAVISSLSNRKFGYIKFIEDHFIKPTAVSKQSKSILVIGSGGFTLGLEDPLNQYTFIDIDGQLKTIAEQKFLGKPLNKNVSFINKPARLFLRQDQKQYDLIVLDAYTHVTSLPQQLLTKEFFLSVKQHIKPQGIVVFNAIVNPHFTDAFSAHLDQTFRSIFPLSNREIIGPYNPWSKAINQLCNVMYTAFNRPVTKDIYSDNLNHYLSDRQKKITSDKT